MNAAKNNLLVDTSCFNILLIGNNVIIELILLGVLHFVVSRNLSTLRGMEGVLLIYNGFQTIH